MWGGSARQNLEEINRYLESNKTPYLGGENPNAVDIALAPRLYHIEVAMKEFQVPQSSKSQRIHAEFMKSVHSKGPQEDLPGRSLNTSFCAAELGDP